MIPDAQQKKKHMSKKLHLTGTSPASTVGAFNDSSNFKLALGDSADTVGSEVGISSLDATQAA